MAITALPTPPSRQDPTNFNDRADAFLGALPAFATEANTLQTNVNTSEVNAVAAAAAVFAATNIVKWVSGTTYANGAVVWSPINGLSYRRITASGSGTTDPSADTTNYKQVNGTGDVSTSGNQTIAGTKTFSSTIVGSVNGNAATATNPSSGGTFVTSLNIGSQSVSYSTTSGTATDVLNALGISQTWQNFTSSRLANTSYTNSTGRPIVVNIYFNGSNSSVIATVNGVSFTIAANGGFSMGCNVIVPTGATYSINAFTTWYELR